MPEIRAEITAVIPCHNHAAYLAGAIESILRQEMPVSEIIVVDDGSNDHPKYVIDSFKNKSILYFYQENQGPSRARNLGLEKASGELISFLDADDRWHPDFIIKMREEFIKDPSTLVAGCGIDYIEHGTGKRIPGNLPIVHSEMAAILERNFFTVSASMYSTEKLKQLGGFHDGIKGVEDWEILIRAVSRGEKINFVQERLVDYQILPDSLSKNIAIMENNSLKMVDQVFLEYNLSENIRSQYARIRALRLLDAAAAYLRAGQPATAIGRLSQAVEIYPNMMEELHTYYALICARQALPFLGSGKELDLAAGLKQAETIIQTLQQKGIGITGKSRSAMYSASARLAYAQNKMLLSQRYWQLATKAGMRKALQSGLILYWLKSIVPPSLLSWLRTTIKTPGSK